MSHSPGPWRVYPHGASVPGYDVCDRIVADVLTGRAANEGPSDADAALIAAAPDLLAALKDVFNLVDEGFLVRDTSKDADPLWALNSVRFVTRLKTAFDAIEKAGG
jgi:hypothetical protein